VRAIFLEAHGVCRAGVDLCSASLDLGIPGRSSVGLGLTFEATK
jgi:hypothetical protein